MRRTFTVAIALLVALAQSSRAQDSVSFAGVDREIAAQLTQVVNGARAHGLPTEPILSKVRLALIVHAPAPKIVATAQAVAARLETARDLLAPNAIDIDITAAEGALSFGVPGDAIKMVRAVRPNQSVAVPLAVLTQLVTSHVSAKQAANIVTELMKRGANNVQLVALGNDVDGDVGRGALPSSSLDVRMRGLTATLAPPPAAATGPGITGLSSHPKP